MHVRLLIILLFILQGQALLGQHEVVRFSHLSTADGLSQNWIKSVYHDSYGYMWFGSGNNGINKFDGTNFTIYKDVPGELHGISHNTINVIYEDRDSVLWVGTQKGLNRYNRDLDRFEVHPMFPDVYVEAMLETGDGRFLIINPYDVRLYDPEHQSVEFLYNNGVSLSYEFFTAATIQLSDTLFAFGTNEGLYLFNLQDYSFHPVKTKIESQLYQAKILSIKQFKERQLWLGTANSGLFHVELSKDADSLIVLNHLSSKKDNQIISGAIEKLVIDRQGWLWLGIENGGINRLLLDSEGNILVKQLLQSDVVNEYSLSDNSIHELYIDGEGIIWIGTYSRGIDFFKPGFYQFKHFKQLQGEGNSINNDHVNVIFGEEDKLWIGTEHGLNVYDYEKESWHFFVHEPDDPTSISSNAIWDIYRASNKELWIATWAGGLNLFDEKTKTFTHFKHNGRDTNSLSSNNVFSIIEDDEGYLWIATMSGGVSRFNLATREFKNYLHSNNPGSLSNNWAKDILFSSKGEVWVLTSGGVNVLNRKTNRFRTFLHDTANKASISNDHGITLFEDSKSQIWIGTENGLNLYNADTERFKYYGEESGLANDVIKAIAEDKHGNLWISTNLGISKFVNGIYSPEQPTFINFNISDGLQGDEFVSRSVFQSPSGEMYFGGIFGYNTFYPDSIRQIHHQAPVVLTGFEIYNAPVPIGENSILKKHISETNEITLSHDQSVFSIGFSALDFLSPEKYNYAYRLQGFNEEWTYAGSKKEATYTNLDPGTYIFEVKVSDQTTVWEAPVTSLKLIIKPPWWDTIFFKIFLGILLAAIGLGFYYYRIRTLRAQKEHLEKTVAARTSEIREKNNMLIQQAEKLNEYNQMLQERQAQIEKKNELLKDQSHRLNINNKLLTDRQAKIEEQSEEIQAQSETLRETNDELLKLNASKDKFFSVVAHDLKNPFNSIMGLIELLEAKFTSWPQEKSLHIITSLLTASKNAYALLENFLTWSRAQRDMIPFEPVVVDILEIFSRTEELVKEAAKNKNIDIKKSITPKGLSIYADSNMMYTVLRNLVSNAIKYTGKGGLVTLSAKLSANKVILEVEDTGVGMSKDISDRLFKIGQQQSITGTENEEGTGLGLILCKEFVEAHNGEIKVSSTPGKGTTFEVILPLAEKVKTNN